VAPSTELRKWFDHDTAKWAAFKERYFRELDEQSDAIERLLVKCREGTVTLIFCAKDTGVPEAAHSAAALVHDGGLLDPVDAKQQLVPAVFKRPMCDETELETVAHRRSDAQSLSGANRPLFLPIGRSFA
jgi:Protein of unknown function, DUF488